MSLLPFDLCPWLPWYANSLQVHTPYDTIVLPSYMTCALNNRGIAVGSTAMLVSELLKRVYTGDVSTHHFDVMESYSHLPTRCCDLSMYPSLSLTISISRRHGDFPAGRQTLPMATILCFMPIKDFQLTIFWYYIGRQAIAFSMACPLNNLDGLQWEKLSC